MAAGVVLIFAAFLAVAVAVVVFSYLAAKKRREAMAAYAAGRGWRFEAEQPLLVDRFTGPPFGLGFGQRAYNVLYGAARGPRPGVVRLRVQDPRPATGSRPATQVHRFSVLGLSMGISLPPLSVDPENFLDRFVGRLTGNDIDLESEDFNRAFTVSCPDRKFASDVLHPQMMEFLLAAPAGRLAVRAGLDADGRAGSADAGRRSTRRSRSWTASPTGCRSSSGCAR